MFWFPPPSSLRPLDNFGGYLLCIFRDFPPFSPALKGCLVSPLFAGLQGAYVFCVFLILFNLSFFFVDFDRPHTRRPWLAVSSFSPPFPQNLKELGRRLFFPTSFARSPLLFQGLPLFFLSSCLSPHVCLFPSFCLLPPLSDYFAFSGF